MAKIASGMARARLARCIADGITLSRLGGPQIDGPSLKHTSAFLPLAISLAAPALVLGRTAIFGTVREVDEGTATLIFQLLTAAQVSAIAFFAIKWPPRAPS
jgi:hypothetical protein